MTAAVGGPFPLGDGEYAEIDAEIKTQGTGSFKYHFGGGVGWGASVNHVDITGIKSLSFDIASDNDGILIQPTEKALLLFSRGNPQPLDSRMFSTAKMPL